MLRNRNGGELEGKGKKASKQKMMVAFVLRDNGTCLYEIFLVPLFFLAIGILLLGVMYVDICMDIPGYI